MKSIIIMRVYDPPSVLNSYLSAYIIISTYIAALLLHHSLTRFIIQDTLVIAEERTVLVSVRTHYTLFVYLPCCCYYLFRVYVIVIRPKTEMQIVVWRNGRVAVVGRGTPEKNIPIDLFCPETVADERIVVRGLYPRTGTYKCLYIVPILSYNMNTKYYTYSSVCSTYFYTCTYTI